MTTPTKADPGARIAPCLWFDHQAEEAASFYTDLLPGRILGRSHYPRSFDNPGGKPRGSLMSVEFELAGTPFTALNGGPQFTINPSISFLLNFDPSRDPAAREHLDATWARLAEGGTPLMPLDAYFFSARYGWIQDRFGVSWQLMLTDPEGEPRPFLTPMLLFVGAVAGCAEQAIDFYRSVFERSRVGIVSRHGGEQGPEVPGTLQFADFSLDGQWFAAMDSAMEEHPFAFNEAVSLQVRCRTQDEVDRFWDRLAEGGEQGPCGWLKDRFGLSWQVVPTRLLELMQGEGAERVYRAMLGMGRLDIAALEAADRGA